MEKVCPNCSKSFEPKNPKGKFCSDTCRVLYSRKAAKELGLKAAKEVPPPKDKPKKEGWIIEIETFCNEHNCTPKDLINGYVAFLAGSKKPSKKDKEWAIGKIKEFEQKEAAPMNDWRNAYRNKKLGLTK